MAKKSDNNEWQNILYYREWAEMLLSLPDELRHKIHDAIDEFIVTHNDPVDEQILYSPYYSISRRILQDKENYSKKIVDRNRENGSKGGRPRKNPNNPENPVGFSEPKKANKNRKGNMIETIKDANASMSSDDDAHGEEDVNHIMLMEYFNMKMTGKAIPTIKGMPPKRINAVNARAKEHGKMSVRTVINKAADSTFLNGGGEKGFVASFDWLFRPANFIKVLEGNYDNKNHKVIKSETQQQERIYSAAALVERLAQKGIGSLDD